MPRLGRRGGRGRQAPEGAIRLVDFLKQDRRGAVAVHGCVHRSWNYFTATPRGGYAGGRRETARERGAASRMSATCSGRC